MDLEFSQSVVITNFSFEEPSIADGTTTSGFGGWSRSGGAGSAISILNPLDAQFSGSTGGAVPGAADGDQVVIIGGSIEMTRVEEALEVIHWLTYNG